MPWPRIEKKKKSLGGGKRSSVLIFTTLSGEGEWGKCPIPKKKRGGSGFHEKHPIEPPKKGRMWGKLANIIVPRSGRDGERGGEKRSSFLHHAAIEKGKEERKSNIIHHTKGGIKGRSFSRILREGKEGYTGKKGRALYFPLVEKHSKKERKEKRNMSFARIVPGEGEARGREGVYPSASQSLQCYGGRERNRDSWPKQKGGRGKRGIVFSSSLVDRQESIMKGTSQILLHRPLNK